MEREECADNQSAGGEDARAAVHDEDPSIQQHVTVQEPSEGQGEAGVGDQKQPSLSTAVDPVELEIPSAQPTSDDNDIPKEDPSIQQHVTVQIPSEGQGDESVRDQKEPSLPTAVDPVEYEIHSAQPSSDDKTKDAQQDHTGEKLTHDSAVESTVSEQEKQSEGSPISSGRGHMEGVVGCTSLEPSGLKDITASSCEQSAEDEIPGEKECSTSDIGTAAGQAITDNPANNDSNTQCTFGQSLIQSDVSQRAATEISSEGPKTPSGQTEESVCQSTSPSHPNENNRPSEQLQTAPSDLVHDAEEGNLSLENAEIAVEISEQERTLCQRQEEQNVDVQDENIPALSQPDSLATPSSEQNLAEERLASKTEGGEDCSQPEASVQSDQKIVEDSQKDDNQFETSVNAEAEQRLEPEVAEMSETLDSTSACERRQTENIPTNTSGSEKQDMDVNEVENSENSIQIASSGQELASGEESTAVSTENVTEMIQEQAAPSVSVESTVHRAVDNAGGEQSPEAEEMEIVNSVQQLPDSTTQSRSSASPDCIDQAVLSRLANPPINVCSERVANVAVDSTSDNHSQISDELAVVVSHQDNVRPPHDLLSSSQQIQHPKEIDVFTVDAQQSVGDSSEQMQDELPVTIEDLEKSEEITDSCNNVDSMPKETEASISELISDSSSESSGAVDPILESIQAKVDDGQGLDLAQLEEPRSDVQEVIDISTGSDVIQVSKQEPCTEQIESSMAEGAEDMSAGKENQTNVVTESPSQLQIAEISANYTDATKYSDRSESPKLSPSDQQQEGDDQDSVNIQQRESQSSVASSKYVIAELSEEVPVVEMEKNKDGAHENVVLQESDDTQSRCNEAEPGNSGAELESSPAVENQDLVDEGRDGECEQSKTEIQSNLLEEEMEVDVVSGKLESAETEKVLLHGDGNEIFVVSSSSVSLDQVEGDSAGGKNMEEDLPQGDVVKTDLASEIRPDDPQGAVQPDTRNPEVSHGLITEASAQVLVSENQKDEADEKSALQDSDAMPSSVCAEAEPGNIDEELESGTNLENKDPVEEKQDGQSEQSMAEIQSGKANSDEEEEMEVDTVGDKPASFKDSSEITESFSAATVPLHGNKSEISVVSSSSVSLDQEEGDIAEGISMGKENVGKIDLALVMGQDVSHNTTPVKETNITSLPVDEPPATSPPAVLLKDVASEPVELVDEPTDPTSQPADQQKAIASEPVDPVDEPMATPPPADQLKATFSEPVEPVDEPTSTPSPPEQLKSIASEPVEPIDEPTVITLPPADQLKAIASEPVEPVDEPRNTMSQPVDETPAITSQSVNEPPATTSPSVDEPKATISEPDIAVHEPPATISGPFDERPASTSQLVSELPVAMTGPSAQGHLSDMVNTVDSEGEKISQEIENADDIESCASTNLSEEREVPKLDSDNGQQQVVTELASNISEVDVSTEIDITRKIDVTTQEGNVEIKKDTEAMDTEQCPEPTVEKSEGIPTAPLFDGGEFGMVHGTESSEEIVSIIDNKSKESDESLSSSLPGTSPVDETEEDKLSIDSKSEESSEMPSTSIPGTNPEREMEEETVGSVCCNSAALKEAPVMGNEDAIFSEENHSLSEGQKKSSDSVHIEEQTSKDMDSLLQTVAQQSEADTEEGSEGVFVSGTEVAEESTADSLSEVTEMEQPPQMTEHSSDRVPSVEELNAAEHLDNVSSITETGISEVAAPLEVTMSSESQTCDVESPKDVVTSESDDAMKKESDLCTSDIGMNVETPVDLRPPSLSTPPTEKLVEQENDTMTLTEIRSEVDDSLSDDEDVLMIDENVTEESREMATNSLPVDEPPATDSEPTKPVDEMPATVSTPADEAQATPLSTVDQPTASVPVDDTPATSQPVDEAPTIISQEDEASATFSPPAEESQATLLSADDQLTATASESVKPDDEQPATTSPSTDKAPAVSSQVDEKPATTPPPADQLTATIFESVKPVEDTPATTSPPTDEAPIITSKGDEVPAATPQPAYKLTSTISESVKPVDDTPVITSPPADEAPTVTSQPVDEALVTSQPADETPAAASQSVNEPPATLCPTDDQLTATDSEPVKPVDDTPVTTSPPADEAPVVASQQVDETPATSSPPDEETQTTTAKPVDATIVTTSQIVDAAPVTTPPPVDEATAVTPQPVSEAPTAASSSADAPPVTTPPPTKEPPTAVDAALATTSQPVLPVDEALATSSKPAQPVDAATATMILQEILKMSESIGDGVVKLDIPTDGASQSSDTAVQGKAEEDRTADAESPKSRREGDIQVVAISSTQDGDAQTLPKPEENGDGGGLETNADSSDHQLECQDNYDEAELVAIQSEASQNGTSLDAKKAKKRIYAKTCRNKNCNCKYCKAAKKAKTEEEAIPEPSVKEEARIKRKPVPANKPKRLSISFTPTVDKVKCSQCASKFDTEKDMKEHFDSVHGNQPKLLCRICEQGFQEDELLRLHELAHLNASGYFICLVCDKTYKRKGDLIRHCKGHAKDKSAPVKRKAQPEVEVEDIQLEEESLPKSKFKRLSVTFTGALTKFRCGSCSLEFDSEKARRDHFNSMHLTPSARCYICEELFKDEKLMEEHEAKHVTEAGFLCLECNQTFKKRQEIEVHCAVHREQSASTTKAKESDKANSNSSSAKPSPAKPTPGKPGPAKSTPGKPGPAEPTPAKQTQVKTRLQPKPKIERREGMFYCDLCGKEFVQERLLEVHKLVHTGDKPFPCTMCDKSFKTANQLEKHERIHTGEKPYQCKYCNKRFHSSSNMRRHERTHTGVKPYICSICDKRLSEKWILKKHEKSHLSIGAISFDD